MYYLIHNISVKYVSPDFLQLGKSPIKKVKRLPKVTHGVSWAIMTPAQTF